MEPMDGHRPPATPEEVRRLEMRLRLEIGLTNMLGIAVLALAVFLFDPPTNAPVPGIPWPVAFLVVIPVYGLGIYASRRLRRPLLRWLSTGRAGEPAPPELRRLLVVHPSLQAAVLLVFWVTMAVALGAARATRAPEARLEAFVATSVGVLIAGIIVSTLSFLADQRILGPWYPRFFAGNDPTRFALPATRVRRRLLMAFVLGAATPMVLIGLAVSDRLRDPEGLGTLEGIVWFLVAVGIAAGLFLTLSVRQSIVRPLELIRKAAEAVRAGDLAASVPVESADELGELSVAFNAMVEGLAERRRIEDLFGRQVGPAVVEKLLSEGFALGGERRTASVLFLDLAGFTRLTQERSPEEVVETLNRVFAVVIREVDARHGFVNKFMGDAVLAIFGAPFDDPDHARHVVEAARAIATGLDAEGVGFGIGVSTGNVVAGNVGAAQRFEYTVVGDAVNEAERLQELTRRRGVPVLVSGSTVVALGGRDGVVPAGEEQLRGRSAPTEIYTLGA